MRQKFITKLSMTALLLLVLAACTQGGLIQTFTASDTTVTAGTEVRLEWRTSNSDTLTLNPAIGDVSGQRSITVIPTQTATYELEARQGARSETKTLTVEVGDAPVINDFEVTPESVSVGTPTSLIWDVAGAESVVIDPVVGRQPAQGRAEVTQNGNGTYPYTLIAENEFGRTEREVVLTVGEGPTISSFTATPERLDDEGGGVALAWAVSGEGDISLTLDDGRDDIESGADDRDVTGRESLSVEDVEQTLTFTLTATDDRGTTARNVTVTVGDPAEGVITLLIAGQSNASSRADLSNAERPSPQVRMLGNDYLWKQASEPTDSNENQVDTVSEDNGSGFSFGAGHSFGLTLGKALNGVTGEPVYLIQTARAGSCVRLNSDCGGEGSWAPEGDRLERSTLFGSANYRAQVSAGNVSNPPASAEGGAVTGIVWYQGEDDGSSSSFVADTNRVMDAFMDELDRPGDAVDGVPVVYVQLGQRLGPEPGDEARNNAYQFVRERQRQMETGYGASARDNYFMVVAHDLPMDDKRHLSTEGQKTLGERIALAYQEHVLGSNVDGTGPRLVSIKHDERIIRVKTTQTLNNSSTYEDYFTVTINGIIKTIGNGGIRDLRRDPGDPTAVRITLDEEPADGVQVIVRYRPPTANPSAYPTSQLDDVVKGQSSELPLPAFGGLVAESE